MHTYCATVIYIKSIYTYFFKKVFQKSCIIFYGGAFVLYYCFGWRISAIDIFRSRIIFEILKKKLIKMRRWIYERPRYFRIALPTKLLIDMNFQSQPVQLCRAVEKKKRKGIFKGLHVCWARHRKPQIAFNRLHSSTFSSAKV